MVWYNCVVDLYQRSEGLFVGWRSMGRGTIGFMVSVEIIFKFQNFARNLTALGSFIFIHRFLDLLLAQQAEILDTVLL